jgi:nicotinamidase/pyrazinamidase
MNDTLLITPNDALIVDDIQNDFLPKGALAVKNGDRIIAIVNQMMPLFDHVVLTQDWHPVNHMSFASNHTDKSPYDIIPVEYGTQTLWPNHCVQGAPGADFPNTLHSHYAHAIIRKGYHQDIDSYSAFIEQDAKTSTGLAGWLQTLSIKRVFICGLATDFCVCYSALDAINLGFEVVLIEDACAGIDLDHSLPKAFDAMAKAGVLITRSEKLNKP